MEPSLQLYGESRRIPAKIRVKEKRMNPSSRSRQEQLSTKEEMKTVESDNQLHDTQQRKTADSNNQDLSLIHI